MLVVSLNVSYDFGSYSVFYALENYVIPKKYLIDDLFDNRLEHFDLFLGYSLFFHGKDNSNKLFRRHFLEFLLDDFEKICKGLDLLSFFW